MKLSSDITICFQYIFVCSTCSWVTSSCTTICLSPEEIQCKCSGVKRHARIFSDENKVTKSNFYTCNQSLLLSNGKLFNMNI